MEQWPGFLGSWLHRFVVHPAIRTAHTEFSFRSSFVPAPRRASNAFPTDRQRYERAAISTNIGRYTARVRRRSDLGRVVAKVTFQCTCVHPAGMFDRLSTERPGGLAQRAPPPLILPTFVSISELKFGCRVLRCPSAGRTGCHRPPVPGLHRPCTRIPAAIC